TGAVATAKSAPCRADARLQVELAKIGVTIGPGSLRRGPWTARVRAPRRLLTCRSPLLHRNRFRVREIANPRGMELFSPSSAKQNRKGKKGEGYTSRCPARIRAGPS